MCAARKQNKDGLKCWKKRARENTWLGQAIRASKPHSAPALWDPESLEAFVSAQACSGKGTLWLSPSHQSELPGLASMNVEPTMGGVDLRGRLACPPFVARMWGPAPTLVSINPTSLSGLRGFLSCHHLYLPGNESPLPFIFRNRWQRGRVRSWFVSVQTDGREAPPSNLDPDMGWGNCGRSLPAFQKGPEHCRESRRVPGGRYT